jgi:D-arabinose 1-dehydrogenase-like Zn-dependent alcohol dehydrogenase
VRGTLRTLSRLEIPRRANYVTPYNIATGPAVLATAWGRPRISYLLLCEGDGKMNSRTYRAVQAVAPHMFEVTDRVLLEPDPGTVRIRVEACGVCHSDAGPVEAERAPGTIHASRAMRSSDASTPSASECRDLVSGTRSILGSPTGSAIENEDNARFAGQNGIRAMIEEFPLRRRPRRT